MEAITDEWQRMKDRVANLDIEIHLTEAKINELKEEKETIVYKLERIRGQSGSQEKDEESIDDWWKRMQ